MTSLTHEIYISAQMSLPVKQRQSHRHGEQAGEARRGLCSETESQTQRAGWGGQEGPLLGEGWTGRLSWQMKAFIYKMDQ